MRPFFLCLSLFVLVPGPVSQFNHIEDYEIFRWTTTEPLPVPFTINEKFLFPAELYNWDTTQWIDPATKKATLDKPKPNCALVQDKVIAAVPKPQAGAGAAAAASS